MTKRRTGSRPVITTDIAEDKQTLGLTRPFRGSRAGSLDQDHVPDGRREQESQAEEHHHSAGGADLLVTLSTFFAGGEMRRFMLAGAIVVLLVGSTNDVATGQEAVEGRREPSLLQVYTPGSLLDGSLARAEADPLEPVIFALPARASRRTGEVLMIVGGAGILVGVLTDESIVTIAGAGVGLYGLYLYLR